MDPVAQALALFPNCVVIQNSTVVMERVSQRADTRVVIQTLQTNAAVVTVVCHKNLLECHHHEPSVPPMKYLGSCVALFIQQGLVIVPPCAMDFRCAVRKDYCMIDGVTYVRIGNYMEHIVNERNSTSFIRAEKSIDIQSHIASMLTRWPQESNAIFSLVQHETAMRITIIEQAYQVRCNINIDHCRGLLMESITRQQREYDGWIEEHIARYDSERITEHIARHDSERIAEHIARHESEHSTRHGSEHSTQYEHRLKTEIDTERMKIRREYEMCLRTEISTAQRTILHECEQRLNSELTMERAKIRREYEEHLETARIAIQGQLFEQQKESGRQLERERQAHQREMQQQLELFDDCEEELDRLRDSHKDMVYEMTRELDQKNSEIATMRQQVFCLTHENAQLRQVQHLIEQGSLSTRSTTFDLSRITQNSEPCGDRSSFHPETVRDRLSFHPETGRDRSSSQHATERRNSIDHATVTNSTSNAFTTEAPTQQASEEWPEMPEFVDFDGSLECLKFSRSPIE